MDVMIEKHKSTHQFFTMDMLSNLILGQFNDLEKFQSVWLTRLNSIFNPQPRPQQTILP